MEEKQKPKKKRRGLKTALMIVSSVLVIGLVAAYFVFDVGSWQPLSLDRITAAARTGAIYDSAGEKIFTLKGAENRVVVPLQSIPEDTRNAFLAAEDIRFYRHRGIDVQRIAGAVIENIRQGGYAQGASTITMQLIRQSHLSTQKTLARKLEEAWLALQLEQAKTKDEILEMYLNYIYFGSGAYGVQAAAQTYFDKNVGDLTLAESAALAATIKAPGGFSPLASPENNQNRRGYILKTMLTEGMIAQSAYDAAIQEELTVHQAEVIDTPYGWFIDAALDEAEQKLSLSSEQLLTGGYHITCTMSKEHQDLMNKQYDADVFPSKASDGTLVQAASACVDTKTGAVLAIVGGRSYDVRRGLNRATQLRRQPGSALKPLAVYAPAIDQHGFTAASVLKDEPTNFNGYKPRNSGNAYYGNVSVRTALKNSLNISTVSLLEKIGVPAGRNYLSKVGIEPDKLDQNLALGLGAMTYGVSPVQLAAAYAPFGNGGTFSQSYLIEKVTDSSGKVVYEHKGSKTRVLSEQSAYLMTSLLQTVTQSGTGAKLSQAGTPVAGKTGTVNMTGGGNRDIWMACYNTEVSCAFWMGFDQPDSSHRLASWVSGGDNTALMAKNYFLKLYSGKKKPQFSQPSGIVALEIDKKSIEWRGEAMLAVKLTPKDYRYTEVFLESNRPTKYSDVWTPPKTPNSFYVSHTDKGQPLLVIQPADSAIYRVQRDAIGESFILTELYGTAGETLYYTDQKAQKGVVYTYRVIPVHAELLNNGILLEGVQAVQIAQVKAKQSVLEDMFGFLFSTGGKEKDNAPKENVQSIFTGIELTKDEP